MNKEKFKRIKKIKDLDDYYERKIDEPQLQKLIKIEKKIDQIESNKAKQTTKEIKLDTQQTIKKIGKRGYKFCKNPACEAQIFINCHKCPHCQFQAKENIQKIIDKNTNQNVIQQRIDKIAKKLDLNKPIYDNTHVYTWKKYLLFKNEFNKRTFYDEQITNNISKLFDIKQEQISDDMQEQNKYIHGDQKRSTYKKINQLDHSSQKEVQVQFNDGDKISIQQYQDHSFPEGSQWNEYFFNLGFPITCLKWAPRKNDDVDQYLACSFNAHNFKDHYKYEMDFITINAYNLEYFIRQGKKYKDAKGFIFIYKIQYDLEKQMMKEQNILIQGNNKYQKIKKTIENIIQLFLIIKNLKNQKFNFKLNNEMYIIILQPTYLRLYFYYLNNLDSQFTKIQYAIYGFLMIKIDIICKNFK